MRMMAEQGVYTISVPDLYHESQEDKPQLQDSSTEALNSPDPVRMNCWNRYPWHIAVDILIVLGVCSLLILIELGLMPQAKSGFYCDDPKISFQFTGDTIGIVTLLLVCIVAPFIIMWSVETYAHQEQYCDGLSKTNRCWNGVKVSVLWYREFLLGLAALLFLTDVAKVLIGEPRPHFLHTCKPDAAQGCTPSEYISEYKCTSTEYSFAFVSDSTKSFPSGHSSASVFTSVFMAWYLHMRLPPTQSWLFLPWAQCMCLVWAALCSLSRITDHRHHWWDVLAGTLLGIVAAVFTVHVFCCGFKSVDRLKSRNTVKPAKSIHENGHVLNGGHHPSVRRLISTASAFREDDKELNPVTMT